MDPIHPIIPISERIPPVTVVPRVERAKRERSGGDAERRRRREPPPEPPDTDEPDDDPRPHIDVSA
jgi:hypothetical protein